MNCRYVVVGALVAILLSAGSTAQAQSNPPTSRFSAEVGIGWDNSISGNINSGAIGTINNQAVVILKNTYEDVYGTGLHLKFGGGYMLNDLLRNCEPPFRSSRSTPIWTRMGDIGVSNLYVAIQRLPVLRARRRVAAVRAPLSGGVRAYGDATIGLGFVDKTDVVLVAPGANLTTAGERLLRPDDGVLALGVNMGILDPDKRSDGNSSSRGAFAGSAACPKSTTSPGTGLESYQRQQLALDASVPRRRPVSDSRRVAT